jgi:hypothetical protein
MTIGSLNYADYFAIFSLLIGSLPIFFRLLPRAIRHTALRRDDGEDLRRITAELSRLRDKSGDMRERYELESKVEDDSFVERHQVIVSQGSKIEYEFVRLFSDQGSEFQSIENLRADLTWNGRTKHRMKVIPLSSSKNSVELMVVFDPPFRENFTWSVSYQAPGFWNPLRAGSIDQLWFTLHSPHYDQIALTVVAPPGRTFEGMRTSLNDTITARTRGPFAFVDLTEHNPAVGKYVLTTRMSPENSSEVLKGQAARSEVIDIQAESEAG